ncbi:MAG TPA: type II toxin-antitoxin system HicA family toxin [Thermomicrobiales bacterium]|nr:type II toxin-antitoxin system HicA family toxin [Thermomicrobiales bacterium]
MAKAPRITAAQMLRALNRDGWTELRTSGSHIILHHPAKPGRPIVPYHSGILAPKTYRSIINEAGLTDEQLRELL